MRIFSINGSRVTETPSGELPEVLTGLLLPEPGYLWLSCTRAELEHLQMSLQAALQTLCKQELLDLHLSDLLNAQLPSRFDFTSQYDLLVFRGLAATSAPSETPAGQPLNHLPARGGPPILRRIETSPVGFVVFDRVLLTVHPTGHSLRDAYATRLLAASGSDVHNTVAPGTPDSRSTGARGIPANPADLMLRIVNQMVDGYLALRRELSQQLDHWQAELLNPRSRFNNWNALLGARLSLHHLDEICEDQRAAVQDWIEALKTWPETEAQLNQHQHDLLQVRSRDVLEHIERVLRHVQRLEQNAETTVQMHFNAQSHRTNEIMRTLTVLTAIFLPLNLIAGIFGMNFDFIPLLHRSNGFWLTVLAMGLTAAGLVVFFWRKRYLERSAR
ncbi:MAG: magnesium transporter CorA [Betaproteobacteria bacterium HGW-Betaproteobacteria-18]|nr:MAG: magnesium transporter CorA [Betaproteobacteria bacterium HGW-Betaproteobacteria-18]